MKESDKEVMIYFQKLERDNEPDLSKMNDHWKELKKALHMGPVIKLQRLVNLRGIVIFSLASALAIFLYLTLKDAKEPNIKTFQPSIKNKINISKPRPDIAETSQVHRVIDSIKPLPKPMRRKTSKDNIKTIHTSTPDSNYNNKPRRIFGKPKSNPTEMKDGTWTIDSLS